MPKALLVASALVGVILHPPVRAEDTVDGRPRPSNPSYLEVDYANTLQGVSALYAVRTCSRGEASPRALEVREVLVDSPVDVTARLVAADGHTVAQHTEPTAICDFAKFAAAYAERNRTGLSSAAQ
jgi:hypothetical protein